MPAIINSDNGVVSGSSGLKTSGGNDGITQFQQNGTTQAAITAAGLFQFNSGYGSVATAYGCRAWVNFNGTGTVAIRTSGNVSSITDNGTGDYTVNFTTAMPDANYSAFGAATDTGNPITALNAVAILGTKTTSSIRAVLRTVSGAATYFDANTFDVAIFR